MILIVGTMVVKLVSLLFKIPISNMLGGTGYSYFTNAYIIFDMLSTIATAGFPVAISKMVSENNLGGRYKDSRKILSLSRKFFLLTGLACMTVMASGAGFFASLYTNPGAKFSIICLSPAVLTCCIMSAYRGYYQGMHNMYPTAVSQIIEAVAKLGLGVGLTWLAINLTKNELATQGTVLGFVYESAAAAENAIDQIAAGAAVLGVTFSTVAGAAYLILRHRICGDGLSKAQLEGAPSPERAKEILKSIISIGVPICLGSLAMSLSANIDMATVTNRLAHIMATNPAPLLASYGLNISQGIIETGQVPNFLYGAYSSTAVNISNLVPALTAGFAISALPSVADAWAKRKGHQVKRSIETVIRVTALVCFPAGFGVAALARPICQLFYGARPESVNIGAPLLAILGIASIFMALTATLTSLLQAMGKVSAPVKIIVVGGIIKLVINFVFVGIPEVNIKAAPISTLICYVVLAAMSLYLIASYSEGEYNYWGMLGKPAVAGIACSVGAGLAWKAIFSVWPSTLAVFPAVLVGCTVYTIVIFLLKGIYREDIMMMPKGEKVAKILEKYALLG